MGIAIDRDDFDESDYARYGERLQANLEALRTLLARPGFGAGAPSLGAELEVDIVDDRARPLAANREVLREQLNPNIQLELTRFNLEYNLDPVAAAGSPFAAIERQLEQALAALREAVKPHKGRIVPIGILPTLRAHDLESSSMTDLPRYRALSKGLRRIRRAPFRIRIDGDEPLSTTCDDVTLEGATTSFQLHLRVEPAHFAATFNAAQLATPLALAVGGNAPIFLEHCLWEETRVALFKQAVDSRTPDLGAWRRAARVPFGHGWVRDGAYELFAEAVRLFPPVIPVCGEEDPVAVVAAGGTPELAELRLQQGTVWQWNRPVYDPGGDGHLRIELRALPSGPTPIDMAANAAYLIGLTTALRERMEVFLPAFPFRYAEFNFYRAAQSGLDSRLLWPTLEDVSPIEVRASELVLETLPLAREGLLSMGVDAEDARRALDVVKARTEAARTGARWQRARLRQLEEQQPRRDALAELVIDYERLSRSNTPVHDWPRDD